MIDRYHPDLLYSDSPLPYPETYGRKLLAHFTTTTSRQHDGRVEAVYNCKQDSQGRWVQDLERGVMDKICPAPWQTDTCVGGWYYDVNLARTHGYKSTATVIQMLGDIVSKNGNLLLNFPPRPDGTLDDDELKILDGMAAWMPINGEAIFGTRPWKVFGESSHKLQGGMFNEDALTLHGPRHPLHHQGRYALRHRPGLAGGRQADGSLAGCGGGQYRAGHAAWPCGRSALVADGRRAGRDSAGQQALRARLRP